MIAELADQCSQAIGLGLFIAGVAALAATVDRAHGAELHTVTVECHDSAKAFTVGRARTFAGARELASYYWEERRDSAAAMCRPHAFEVNAH